MVNGLRTGLWIPLWIRTVLVVVLTLPGVSEAAGGERARVVVLFAGPDVGVWQRTFSAEFLNHPRMDHGDPPLSVAMENLALYDADPERIRRTLALLEHRQRSEPVRVVVAIQSVASRFLMEHGDQLYPGIPRLLVLPGRDLAERAAGHPTTRIITSAIGAAIGGTMDLIPELVPGVRKVFVIAGAGELDQAYLDYAHLELDHRASGPAVEYLAGLTLAELRDRVASAPPDSAALLLTYEGDPSGASYRTAVDVLPVLRQDSAIPIFGVYDTLLGTGVAGGVMTSTRRYGRLAAELVLEALAAGGTRGRPAEAATRTVFDARVLNRFEIPLGRLPGDAEIINHARPAYLAYLWQMLAGLAVIAVQALLIVALWRLWRQRSRAARALQIQADDLNRQKGLFESVIGSIPDAIVITNVDGTIIASNDQGFRETFGLEPSLAVGRHCRELATGEHFTKFESALRSAPRILDFAAADGRTFPGEWAGTRVVSGSGEHLGYVLVVRDVTERIAHEEERRQAHKMEALGSLAGGIAHDFNNILAVILGSAELILANADPADHAQQIVRAGNRARGLIDQILAFSRRGSTPVTGPVSVRGLMEESVRFLEASLPRRIELLVDLPKNFDAIVAGNESQLQQVLMNLCANARDAMPTECGDGRPNRLCIRVDLWSVAQGFATSHGQVRPGDYVVVEVADTGPGMTPMLQRRVFDPFFTTKGPGQGTGMGLALVYGIIQAHGGAIDLVSAPGEGSRFVLYLPVLHPGAPAQAEAADLAAVLRPGAVGGAALYAGDGNRPAGSAEHHH